MQRESFEKKLFILRNIEGDPNHRELAIIRQLEDELRDNKTFIGIAPFGSVVGGYSTEKSDIDLFLLFDSSKAIDVGQEGIDNSEELYKKVDAWEKKVWKSERININTIFRNINPQHIIHDLELGIKRGDPGEFISTIPADMSRVITGNKINQYRKVITEALNALTADQRKKLVDEIMGSLVRSDERSLQKRLDRMPALSVDEHLEIMGKREQMWWDRVQKIWNL